VKKRHCASRPDVSLLAARSKRTLLAGAVRGRRVGMGRNVAQPPRCGGDTYVGRATRGNGTSCGSLSRLVQARAL